MSPEPRISPEGEAPVPRRPEGPSRWAAFARPQIFLPREHGGWFLFLAPLAVGIGVAGQWNHSALAFAVAALALYMGRRPLELAMRSLQGKRLRDDLPAVLAWLAIYGALAAAAGCALLLSDRLRGLAPLGLAGAGLLALQLWATATRRARTFWSEVIATTGLSLAATGAHYAAAGAWTITAWVLWALMSVIGVGGVLYSRWRLRRRRLSANLADEEGPRAVPRTSVIVHYGGGLILVLLLGLVGLAPCAVAPLYAVLLARVLWGTRPGASPDRTVLAIGLGEGVAVILSAVWIIAAYRV